MKFILPLLLLSATGLLAQQDKWLLISPVRSFTIVANPQNPRVLYSGNWANQIYRSEDAGASWERMEIGGLDVLNYITSFAVSSKDTNVLLAGGFNFDGIRRSSDRGVTWERVLTDSDFNKMSFISEAIIEDHASPGTFYGARGVSYNDIWKSTDNGVTWDTVTRISDELTPRLCTITQRADSTNIFFIGAKQGMVLRSDDYCKTWRATPINGYPTIKGDAEIPKIVFSPTSPNIGYAVVTATAPDSLGNNGGVLKTTDGGQSWTRIGFVDTSFWAVEARPRAGAEDEVFIGGFRIMNRPTVLKGDSLVYRSLDAGSSWTRYENIPWGENESGDTIRNVWSLRWFPTIKKLFMATEPGIYVLDEPTSVSENTVVRSHQSLRCNVLGNTLVVHDNSRPLNETTEWALYSMQAVCVSRGVVGAGLETEINLASLPSGIYLVTWGTEQHFRTAHIALVR